MCVCIYRYAYIYSDSFKSLLTLLVSSLDILNCCGHKWATWGIRATMTGLQPKCCVFSSSLADFSRTYCSTNVIVCSFVEGDICSREEEAGDSKDGTLEYYGSKVKEMTQEVGTEDFTSFPPPPPLNSLLLFVS
ncbi:UNVERIFIED_CONTAM: hypothetical protein K2H54_056863 [Gekko kuhli]